MDKLVTLIQLPELADIKPYLKILEQEKIPFEIKVNFREFDPFFAMADREDGYMVMVGEIDLERATICIERFDEHREKEVSKPVEKTANQLGQWQNKMIPVLVVVCITLAVGWYSAYDDLQYYTGTDIMYVSKEANDCVEYRWKSTDKLASKNCYLDEDDQFDLVFQYNQYGELLFEMMDAEGDLVFEMQSTYNQAGVKTADFFDLDKDEFFDKMVEFRDTVTTTYIDKNKDGFFDKDEITEKKLIE